MYNREKLISWEDSEEVGILYPVYPNMYEVRVADDITLKVSRALGDRIGHYLGIFIINSDGLSSESRGLIGK